MLMTTAMQRLFSTGIPVTEKIVRTVVVYGALLFLLARCFLVDHCVFCSDELHERDEVFRGSECEGCPGRFFDLVSGSPVNRLVFDYSGPCLLVGVYCCADLFSSCVDVE